MAKYVYSYHHGDGEWCLELEAEDIDDARERVASIRRTLRLDGEIKLRFPTWAAPFVALWPFGRNNDGE